VELYTIEWHATATTDTSGKRPLTAAAHVFASLA
jgi:hypothetical protein